MSNTLKDQHIFIEQVKLIAKQAPSMILLTLVTTVIISVALMGKVENWIPLSLTGAMIILNGVRFWHYYRYKNEEITVDNVDYHGFLFVVFSFISGSIWGSLGVIPPMLPDPFLLILTAALICGLVAGSVSYLSNYKMAFYAYAIPCISPFAIRCVLSEREIFVAIGLLMFLFLMVNLFISHMAQKNVLRSINLVQENQELIARLKYEKTDADEARNIADHNNIAKSRFLATASHDLRQPLQAMVFFVEALQHEKNPDKIKTLIKKVAQTSDALSNLLGSLLDISRIEAGGLEPNRSHFNLNEILLEITQEFTEQAQEKGLNISYNSGENVVHSDKEMLGRIIRNLISNAIHYTDYGYVNISCDIENGFVTIHVADSGIGISESNKKDIYREFFQVPDDDSRPSIGLGLGLSIVDGLCRLLDHEIRLVSEEAVGSIFSIKVPQGDLSKVVLAVPELNILPGDVIAKVIILNNEPASLESISGIMRHWGHVVVDFSTCAEVMEFLSTEDFIPDLVISDINLKDVSGVEAIDTIQAQFPNKIAGIMLTGDDSKIAKEAVQPNGFSVLQKPIQPAKLRSMVAYLVQGRARTSV